MNNIRHYAGVPALCAFLALSACGGTADEATPVMAGMGGSVQPYTEPEERYANPGSIFSESSSGMLFEDSRARRVGDIILIKIVENTKASNQADTKAERESTVDVGVSALLGRKSVSPVLFGGVMAGQVGQSPLISASTKIDHEASGKTSRSNSVTTTIGGRVINVLPNGVLEVAGAREIKVNTETEYMVIKGLVRGSDVLSDNSVLSTQLANSSIGYYGKGTLAEKQAPGWLSRFLDMIWPF
ncbi:MAG: flagellar basal body L-ring protein FlgH [Deltaproteobacteria bacterium]|jgi:flagellar L-ring protein precursor FlgH|nr:flagellar basal body L-ring protein FlgH [Deltaproteobacteria bacterium]